LLYFPEEKRQLTHLHSGRERSAAKNCTCGEDRHLSSINRFTIKSDEDCSETGEKPFIGNAATFAIETVKELDFLKHLQYSGKRNTASAAKRGHAEGLPALP
jgi:hypothetical protein